MINKQFQKHKDVVDWLKGRFIKLKDPLARRHLYVFFICLLISIFVWLSIKLSDEYQATMKHTIEYINVPADKILTNKPPQFLNLKVEGLGMQLLRFRIGDRDKPIKIDLSRAQFHEKYGVFTVDVPTTHYLAQIASQSRYYNNLIDIKPDTLHLEFEMTTRKKVPVINRVSYKLDKQVWLRRPVDVEPDSVMVSGIVSSVDRVNGVYTKKVDLGVLKDAYKGSVALERFVSKNLTIKQDSVRIGIPCERYTESQMVIPIEIPSSMGHIRTFPEEVTVTYWVSLKDYKRIDPDLFHATATLNQESDQFLEVVVDRKPGFIQEVDINPSRVEFIYLK